MNKTQVAEQLCLIAAGLPPEDSRAHDHFKPYSSRDAHVLQQLRFSFHAATAPAEASSALDHKIVAEDEMVAGESKNTVLRQAASTTNLKSPAPTSALPPASGVPCRGRLSAVLRHVLEVCKHVFGFSFDDISLSQPILLKWVQSHPHTTIFSLPKLFHFYFLVCVSIYGLCRLVKQHITLI